MQNLFSKLTIGVALTAFVALAQTKPSFEVATVKPSPPLDMAKMAAAVQSGQMPKMGARGSGKGGVHLYGSARSDRIRLWR